MMEKLRPQAQGVQISAMQFLEQPNPARLTKFGGSLHDFIGLPRWPMLASNRDPTLQEYGVSKPSNNSGCYTVIHSGGQLVTPARYMEAIKAINPEMFVALADEVLGDAQKKRVAASVDRTAKWLDECIEQLEAMGPKGAPPEGQQQQQQEQQQDQQQHHQDADKPAKRQRREQRAADACAAAAPAAAGDSGGGGRQIPEGLPLVLAPVMGGSIPEERARSAKAAAAKPVAGFALCGFGMGEDVSLHPQLLEAAIEQLPVDKPRLLLGMGTPEEVLEGVLHGADIFDCGYPTHATANGYALYFPLRLPREAGGPPVAVAAAAGGLPGAAGGIPEEGADDSKINLWAQQYRTDKRPLVEGCACFACRNHTRAYIHHLLHAHEMLASVLLEVHNTHWWLEFFEAMRDAVTKQQLAQYAAWFKERRRAARRRPAAAPAPAPAAAS